MLLLRLVYLSTNTTPGGGAVAANLKQILTSSIRNNSDAGITGGLLFNRNYFIQVLEGERSNLLKVFTHISVDPRHKDVVLVDQKPISKRAFHAWSMGFAGNTELFDLMLARFCPSEKFDPREMTADQLYNFTLEMVMKENGIVSSPAPALVEI